MSELAASGTRVKAIDGVVAVSAEVAAGRSVVDGAVAAAVGQGQGDHRGRCKTATVSVNLVARAAHTDFARTIYVDDSQYRKY